MGDFSGMHNPDLPASPDIVFALFLGAIVIGFIVVIALAIRSAVKVKRAGHDPLMLQTDLALKVMDSQALAPTKSLEQRLREVDDLLARGVVTQGEHAAARAAILAG